MLLLQTTVFVHVQVLQAAFGGSPSSLYGNALKLLAASPLDACSFLANAGQVAGTVLLMQRGNCTFASKVQPYLVWGADAASCGLVG